MNSYIHLDNNTITKPSKKTIKAMMPYLEDKWGLPTSPYKMGQDLIVDLKGLYKKIYNFLGAKEEDTILFTSSGSEAINQVIWSTYLQIALKTGKNQFITSNVDEAAIILGLSRLEQLDCVVKTTKVNEQGYVTAKEVIEAMTPRTALVSLSWGNGLTGVIQPIAEIADICKERGVLLHIDATHVLGKLYFELEDIEADFISFSGETLHAPKGCGGLYIKNGIKVLPLIVGGNDQAHLRAGALDIPNLSALAQACEELQEARDFITTEISRLRTYFEKEIEKRLANAKVLFKTHNRLPNISVISFEGIINESLLFYLNQKKINATIGGGNFQQLAILLKAYHFDDAIAHSSVSFSLSKDTTAEEIDAAIEIIVECVNHLNKISTTIR
ncbi:MAG: iron-sulfur protein [Chlamydia sp. 32-24]|nr:MAG: iron-sulfur protein [Chlamydia sp. 32-24]